MLIQKQTAKFARISVIIVMNVITSSSKGVP